MKRQLGIILMALILCAGLDTATAKTYKLKFGASVPPAALPLTQELENFYFPTVMKRVKKETGHKIVFEKFWGGAMAKMGEYLETIEAGVLDMGTVAPIFENPHLFSANYGYFAPFGTRDVEMAQRVNQKVWNTVPWLKKVFEEEHNQKIIGHTTYGSYELITTFPVRKMSDLNGRKIAAAGPNIPWLKGTGAIPVQSNLGEAYMSMQTGVYEGWIMIPTLSYAFKLHEIAKYNTNVGFGCISGIVFTINLDSYNALPGKIQQILLEVGEKWMGRQAALNAAKQKKIEDIMTKAGVTIIDLPQNERKRWMEGIRSLASEKVQQAKKYGQPLDDILRLYVDELENAGYQWPIRWKIQ